MHHLLDSYPQAFPPHQPGEGGNISSPVARSVPVLLRTSSLDAIDLERGQVRDLRGHQVLHPFYSIELHDLDKFAAQNHPHNSALLQDGQRGQMDLDCSEGGAGDDLTSVSHGAGLGVISSPALCLLFSVLCVCLFCFLSFTLEGKGRQGLPSQERVADE